MKRIDKAIENQREYINTEIDMADIEERLGIYLSEIRDAAEMDMVEIQQMVRILRDALRHLTSNDNVYGTRCDCCGTEPSVSFRKLEFFLAIDYEKGGYRG